MSSESSSPYRKIGPSGEMTPAHSMEGLQFMCVYETKLVSVSIEGTNG